MLISTPNMNLRPLLSWLAQIALLEHVLSLKVEQMASMNPIPASVARDYVLADGGDPALSRQKAQQGKAGAAGVGCPRSKVGRPRQPVTAQLPTHAQMLAKSGVGRSGPVPASRPETEDPMWQKLSIEQVGPLMILMVN